MGGDAGDALRVLILLARFGALLSADGVCFCFLFSARAVVPFFAFFRRVPGESSLPTLEDREPDDGSLRCVEDTRIMFCDPWLAAKSLILDEFDAFDELEELADTITSFCVGICLTVASIDDMLAVLCGS